MGEFLGDLARIATPFIAAVNPVAAMATGELARREAKKKLKRKQKHIELSKSQKLKR